MDPLTLSVDDCEPLPIRTPGTAAEVAGLVREVAAAGAGFYPVGGRTTLDLGLPPTKRGYAVDLRGLNKVVDYPARDMTITVQAGVTVAELNRTLAAENQWLPVDVPQPERATVGGALAVNASGPRRLGYGTLRDYLIGVSFVAADGAEVKAGGRVVKNVAGYDLMKLHIGALGTLGVLTQVTLKVKPKPEAAAVVTFGCEPAALGGVLDLLHASMSRPVVADVSTAAGGAWAVTVAFEEKKATLGWQLSTLRGELKAAGLTAGPEEREGADFAPAEAPAGSPLSWKAGVRPSRVAAFLATAAGPNVRLHAHALNGIVHGHVAAALTQADVSAMVNKLADAAADAGGNLTVRRCPPAWKAALPVWGRPTADRALMRHVKRTLDPDDVFNPGRLFGDS